jgi:ATP adenylyltransferase
MKKIYAPWRSKYVEESVHTKKDNECVFCKAIKENDDEKNFILKRGKYCTTIMNIYPYNAGHLMIIPNEHKANLSDLSADTRAEIMEEVNFAIEAIKKTLNPSAFNVGVNLGKASGGGMPSHLHIHIVPRWEGDTNFMAVIAETKQVSFDLKDIYKKIKPSFEK